MKMGTPYSKDLNINILSENLLTLIKSDMRYYGDHLNTMSEILLSRYEYFLIHHMITHLTTNLTSSEIEACYGKRIRSCMKKIFNLISFPKEAEDKRR